MDPDHRVIRRADCIYIEELRRNSDRNQLLLLTYTRLYTS